MFSPWEPRGIWEDNSRRVAPPSINGILVAGANRTRQRGCIEDRMSVNLRNKRENKSLPIEMEELIDAERLLLKSYRRWVVGMQLCDNQYLKSVWIDLSTAFGVKSAQSIIGGLQSVIAAIGGASRRPIRLYPLCCVFVCADELLFLCLISACQSRNHFLARCTANWIVSANGTSDLIEGCRRIAEALTEKDIVLPIRTDQQQSAAGEVFNETNQFNCAPPQLRVVEGGA